MSDLACTGVWPAVATPFGGNLEPDESLLCDHCEALLGAGASGLSLLGTTGEANSLSVGERKRMLEAVIACGIEPELLLPGTGCSALTDTVELTKHAVSAGCRAVLLLPPYYCKAVAASGLYAFVREVIRRVESERLRIYLYHIPQVSLLLPTVAIPDRDTQN